MDIFSLGDRETWRAETLLRINLGKQIDEQLLKKRHIGQIVINLNDFEESNLTSILNTVVEDDFKSVITYKLKQKSTNSFEVKIEKKNEK